MSHPRNYWTLERLQADALQYPTKKAWRKESSAGYGAAHKKGVFEECCGHMEDLQRPNGYWTLERLQADASQYQTRAAWKKGSSAAYDATVRGGFLEECCGHMKRLKSPSGYWTPEKIRADALRFQTRGDWKKGSKAYRAAREQGLLDECCGHMEKLRNPKGHWTPERLQADALRFQTRVGWQKGSPTAYGTAREQGLLEECCGHTELQHKSKGYWTLERIKADALQYQTRAAWQRGSSSSAYAFACRRGVLEECCGHMDRPLSDNDTIYFWKAEGTEFYKLGVTSERLGTQRIDQVAESSGFTPVVLVMTTVVGRASEVETELLSRFNRSAGLEGFNGCTEFRHLASWEAAEVVSILATANN